MAKQPKKKYYAIREGKGVQNIIVTTWGECEKFVHGYPAIYKSFLTEDEAKDYLDPVKKVKKKIAVSSNEFKEHNLVKRRKSKKANTVILEVELSRDIYNKFLVRCKDLNVKPKKILDDIMLESLEEWVED